jgi:hypothetical protein
VRSGVGGDLAISISDDFRTLLDNIAVDNAETISLRYGEITRALNLGFRSTDSRTANSLQVGSYGRGTAIKGISDLDMLYIVPEGCRDTYRDKGQYRLLRKTADEIQTRYKSTTIYVDRLVVVVEYNGFKVEVQPVFEEADGSFSFPDTKGGGRWRTTLPRDELKAIADADRAKNWNLRRLCKVARAWRNKHGVVMGGLLIDTLAYNFLQSTNDYDERSYLYYDWMVRDFFLYLANLPAQTRYNAIGSNQHVTVYKKFQSPAKKAYDLTINAIEAGDEARANERWRKIFGRGYPNAPTTVAKAYITEGSAQARNTEEFIEDSFPVDIRYSIKIECEVKQSGFRTIYLRASRAIGVPRLPVYTSKSLKFYLTSDHTIPPPSVFHLYWKVLNRGEEAVRRDLVRGEIIPDDGSRTRTERSQFRGEHVVDCYAVQNGVVVAKDRIHVRIVAEQEA